MVNISGKKILFIGIGFYDYEEAIKYYLETRGAEVSYFSSFFNSKRQRFFRRIGMTDKSIRMSSDSIMTKIKDAPQIIDEIIIIKAEDFGQEHIDAIYKKYPRVKKTLYLWDSLERLPNKDILLSNFERILTFDRKDAEKYHLIFRPLFARNLKRAGNSIIKYDISFVGYLHSMRYDVLKRLKRYFRKEGIKYRFILTTGKFQKWFLINISHEIDKEDAEMIVTSHLPYSDYLDILYSSNVILDIAHPKQSGLTMRTIETLGAGKKLLTTNSDIRNYSFNESQYRILSDAYDLDYKFIRDHDVKESDMGNYSLERFMDDILEA